MKIIYNNGLIEECPKEDELHILRHTAAHVLAQAVKRLFPYVVFVYGPATDNGFYYDMDLGDTRLSDADLQAIEAEMRKIVKENLAVKPFVLERQEAISLLEQSGEKYKVEHISDLADEQNVDTH